jgi:hypothetical protein
MAISCVFINSFSKNYFFPKQLILRTDSAASSRGQVNVTYFMYCPWPPLEAEWLISVL